MHVIQLIIRSSNDNWTFDTKQQQRVSRSAFCRGRHSSRKILFKCIIAITTATCYCRQRLHRRKKHMNRIQVGKHTERQYPINIDRYQHLRSQQNEASRLAVVHSKTRGHLKLILYQHCRFCTSTQCNNISYGYNIAGYFSEMSAADLLSLYTVIAMDDHAGWAKKLRQPLCPILCTF